MTRQPEIFLSTLPNGVQVVTCRMPHVESFTMGIWAAVGSRHEPARLNGISHFLEHLLFKGTPRRSARAIVHAVEGYGGDINAHTSEERTCYVASAPSRQFSRIADVLCDLYLHSKLAEKDIDLERAVIGEEISMYRDEPDQHVHDLLGSIFWPGHALGRPITGTHESIARIGRRDFLEFRDRHYCGANTILSAAGDISHERVVAVALSALGGLPRGRRARDLKASAPREFPSIAVEQRDIAQAHLSMGWHIPGFLSEERYALYILHLLLGGNGSSRLFQEMRERRGLCYSVSTATSLHSDSGMFNVCFSLDPENIQRTFSVLREQLRRVRETPPGAAELRRAVEFAIGSSSMSLEKTGSQNSRIGLATIAYGKVTPLSEWRERMRSISRDDIRQSAEKFLSPDRFCLAVIGPGGCRALADKIRLSDCHPTSTAM